MWNWRHTNHWTDRCYQSYYLPASLKLRRQQNQSQILKPLNVVLSTWEFVEGLQADFSLMQFCSLFLGNDCLGLKWLNHWTISADYMSDWGKLKIFFSSLIFFMSCCKGLTLRRLLWDLWDKSSSFDLESVSLRMEGTHRVHDSPIK